MHTKVRLYWVAGGLFRLGRDCPKYSGLSLIRSLRELQNKTYHPKIVSSNILSKCPFKFLLAIQNLVSDRIKWQGKLSPLKNVQVETRQIRLPQRHLLCNCTFIRSITMNCWNTRWMHSLVPPLSSYFQVFSKARWKWYVAYIEACMLVASLSASRKGTWLLKGALRCRLSM